jgi:hypothetical protein
MSSNPFQTATHASAICCGVYSLEPMNRSRYLRLLSSLSEISPCIKESLRANTTSKCFMIGRTFFGFCISPFLVRILLSGSSIIGPLIEAAHVFGILLGGKNGFPWKREQILASQFCCGFLPDGYFPFLRISQIPARRSATSPSSALCINVRARQSISCPGIGSAKIGITHGCPVGGGLPNA